MMMNDDMIRHVDITAALFAGALALLAGTGCTEPEPAAETADLVEIPAPDLSGAEETVRRQIEEQLAEVEARSAAGEAEKLGRAYGELGLLYVTYNFLDAAKACFLNAQSLEGDHHQWPYLLGYLMQIQGQLEEASAALERALELRAADPPSLIRLGRVRLELGASGEARPLFEQTLALDPRSAAALDGLGRVAAAAGETARAVEYFERVLALQPKAASVHHALGLAYRRLGDLERAEDHLSRGGEAPVLFQDPYLSMVTEMGRTADIYMVRGAQAFSEGRYGQSAGYYRKALEIDPTIFDARKALGFCLEKLGDVEGAVDQLEEGLRQGTSGDPERDALERAELLRILGGLQVLQGQEPEAIETFRRSLELDPERLDPRLKLANALARRGSFEEAIDHYDYILGVDPDLSKVLVLRATARINLGQRQPALADFRQALVAAPEDPEPRLRFAEALEHFGDAAGAAALRRDAARLAESDPQQQARILAGEADKLLRRGELAQALEGYRQALSLDSGNIDARYQMATVLAHTGRYDDALVELAKVIEAAPHHGPARRAEVTVLLLQGRNSDARGRLEGGLEAMPRNQELAHALARLLATAPNSEVRDGALALDIASRVHQEAQRSDTAETLAMAFAEAGRFAEAQELQRQLVSTAESAGRKRAAEHWSEQLRAYEQARPWRARSPDEVISTMTAPGSGGSPGR